MKRKILIIVQIITMILLVGCSSSDKHMKYSYLSGFTCPTGDEYVSEINLDFGGSPIVYYRDTSLHRIYDISTGEMRVPLLDESITKQFEGIGYAGMSWELSDLYFKDDGGYICVDLINDESGIVGFDDENNKMYDLNISQIIEDETEGIYTPGLFTIDVYKCLNNKICVIINSLERNSKSIIINPISEEILNTVEIPFFPKFVAGNQLVGVSENCNQIITMDLESGEIKQTLDTGCDDSNYGLGYLDTNIYMINENGIFIANEGDVEFKCIIEPSDMFAFEKDIDNKTYIKSGFNSYKIYVKNKNEIYVCFTYPDESGYGYENHFVLFTLE